MIYGLVESGEPFQNPCNSSRNNWILVPYDCLSKEGARYLERRNANILNQMDPDSRAEFLFEMYGVVVGEE